MQSVGDINLNSYVWQPWFATLNSGLGVAYERQTGRPGNEGGVIRYNGDVSLSVLPQSRFPTQLSYSRIDNRVSGEFVGADFVENRLSATTTSILTSDFRTNLGASFDWSQQNRLGDRQSRRLFGGAVKTFDGEFAGITSISAHVDYSNSDFASTVEGNLSSDILTADFAIQAQPAKNFRNQLIFTYIRDDEVSRIIVGDRHSVQAVNSFNWNPESGKFDVDGFIRARLEEIDFADRTNNAIRRNNQLFGVTNVNVPINDRLSVHVGVRAGYDGQEGDNLRFPTRPDVQRRFAAVNGAVNYYSRPRDFGRYEWRWGARAAGEAGWSSQPNVLRKPTAAVNQTLERELDIFGANSSRISLTQEVGFDAGAVDRNQDDDTVFAPIASHSVNFTHSRADRTASTSFNVSLRDLREFAGEKNTVQTGQIQFSRRQLLDARRSFTGVLTGNVLRRKLNGKSDTFVTLTGRLIYSNRSVFEVINLDFRSELAINIFQLEQLFSDNPTPSTLAEDIQHHEWRNTLTYRIGKIAVVGEASAFYEDEGFGNLFMLRIRRDFGGH
ncbi:MAG TPA: hypothetical protein VNH64_04390 [Parvularculaceae bacterium]|nr:hypothetical protein [Parvularculaceae bacterium]